MLNSITLGNQSTTRHTEDIAEKYLLQKFNHPIYEFRPKRVGDKGFDLWLFDREAKSETKVELKAHSGTYNRPSNLFERLVFNAEIERTLVESGETVIARVFVGAEPFRIFIITNLILGGGAKLEPEARYVLRGKINYANSITELA